MVDLVAKFSLNEENNIDAIFKIDAAGTTWGSIDGTLSNQKDLQSALNLKADKSTVEANFETLSETVSENYTTLDTKIDSVQSDLSGDITTLSNTVTSNNTAVNNRINTTNTNLSNLQTTVNNNNTAVNNRVNTLETSFDADIEELNTHLSDLSEQISETDINLTSLSATVSNNYTTLDNKIDGVNSELSGNIGELETELTELTTTVSNNNTAINQKVDSLETTLTGDINTLSGTVSSNYTTLDTKVDNTKTELEGDISALSGTVASNYNDLNSAITASAGTINTRIDNEVDDLNVAITTETTTRANADNNLQSQIDAITAASDVVDIVGTYAALQAYNTSALQNNDIIKVLSDENRDYETAYYRWLITGGVGVWSFIGEEGPYYTKSEADCQFVPQTRTINNKTLTSNITLSYSDVNALPDTTIIGEGVLLLQKNGEDLDTFNANATTNKTININVPTTVSELTNDTGFITNADLSDIETTIENNTSDINTLSDRIDTVETNLNSKVDKITGKGLSSNDFTDEYKTQITTNTSTISSINNVLENKQDTLTAGTNIQINNNVISATDTTYSAGTGISIENGIISNTQTSAEWGNITGILSNQTDLQSALNAKQNTIPDLETIRSGASDGATAVQPATLENYVPQNQLATDEQYGIVKPDGNSVYIYDGKLTAIQRNIGEIIQSALPLTDAGLHLLDGTLLLGDGIYTEFVDYIDELYNENPSANYFTTETEWQNSVTTYGSCGKFVYDSENNTVRLPKISNILQGTTDVAALGALVEAGVPNITAGTITISDWSNQETDISGAWAGDVDFNTTNLNKGTTANEYFLDFDASRCSTVYGNSSTVQPQTIKCLVYIVIATSAKTDIQVNIDNIATDLNSKAGTDLVNITDSAKVMVSALGMPTNSYKELTLGASNSTYTAPSNGYFIVSKRRGDNAESFLTLYNDTLNYSLVQRSPSNGSIIVMIPARKGDIIRAEYTITGATNYFRFYYAQGAQSEAK